MYSEKCPRSRKHSSPQQKYYTAKVPEILISSPLPLRTQHIERQAVGAAPEKPVNELASNYVTWNYLQN